MSSTGRASDRVPLDDYPTQRWCVHRLLEKVKLEGGLWVEPCAGAGSIIKAVNEVRSDVEWGANEINEEYQVPLMQIPNVVGVSHHDSALVAPIVGQGVNITNPPFIPSMEILLMLLQNKKALTIFLQRLNWCCGPRREIFRELRPSVYPLPDRPSFTDILDEKTGKISAGTDSIEYAWFVFDGHGDFLVLDDTPEEVRKAEIDEARKNGTRRVKVKKEKET